MSSRKPTWITPRAFLERVKIRNITTYELLEIDPPGDDFTCDLCNQVGTYYASVRSRCRFSGLVLCFDHSLLLEAVAGEPIKE